jgi:hypothetical protein
MERFLKTRDRWLRFRLFSFIWAACPSAHRATLPAIVITHLGPKHSDAPVVSEEE